MPTLQNYIDNKILDLRQHLREMFQAERISDCAVSHLIHYCPNGDQDVTASSLYHVCLEFRDTLRISINRTCVTNYISNRIVQLVHACFPFLAILPPNVEMDCMDIKLRGFSSENNQGLIGEWLPPMHIVANQLQQAIEDAHIGIDILNLKLCDNNIQVLVDAGEDPIVLSALLTRYFHLYGHPLYIEHTELSHVRISSSAINSVAATVFTIYFNQDAYTGIKPLPIPFASRHWIKPGFHVNVVDDIVTQVSQLGTPPTIGSPYDIAEYLAEHLDQEEHVLLVQALSFANMHAPATLMPKMKQLINKVCPA